MSSIDYTPCAICALIQPDPPQATYVRRVPALQGEPAPVCRDCAVEIELDHPHRPVKVHERVLLVADGVQATGWCVWIDSAGTAVVCITSADEPALVGTDRLIPADRACAIRSTSRRS